MNGRPVLILAGGTGGHVYPALEVARLLATRFVPVHWLGGSGIETRLVPAAGIAFSALPVRGIRGTGTWNRVLTVPKLLLAVAMAWRLILRLRPRVVIGFGGYASGAGGVAAYLARCPLVIHEQNAVAGMTNRMLARFGAPLLEGFPGAFPGKTARLCGNPVRPAICQLPSPRERLSGRSGPVRILVVGGSQGARALNQMVPACLAKLEPRFDIWHLTGPNDLQGTVDLYKSLGLQAKVAAYEEHMEMAYGWAELVIARAGALTLSEIMVGGVASILIPYPTAADDHQTRNAEYLEANGAARCIPQAQLSPERLGAVILDLTDGQDRREQLLGMAEKAQLKALPNAGQCVVDALLQASVSGEAP